MNDATIKSTVGVQMSPEGMASAAKQLDSVLQKTIASLNKASGSAERAVNNSAKAGQAATQQMNGQLKALAITLGQIKTLQASLTSIGAKGTLNSAALLGDFGATGSIGRQARALTDYRNSLNGASSAVTTLRDRVKQFDQQAGNLAKRGQTLSQGQIFKAEKLNETAKAYSRINNEIGGLRSRVALLSSDGQKAFKPMLDQLNQLEKTNAKAFANRRRTNFQPEVTATQKLVRNVKERLVAREKLEKSSRLNLEALRQEGLQITRNTALEREAALAKSVRAANTRFNNLQLIGGTIRQRDTDQVSRYARATALAATTQNQLTAALNRPNTSARRIQTLIARHKQLQREIGETISAQNRQQTSGGGGAGGGGFFAGLRQGRTNAFSGDEGGGAFGAGALVGRVASYAVAAAAVYGVISALQQGISFTIQFEDALAQLQAVSGSTALEMDRLSTGILEVSKNSANSILELTKSATVIAQAGFAGNEIEQILQNVVNLSAAAGSSTDQSVDILTSSLGAFQLSATEATRVTDILVSALNDSKLAVNQVQLGLQFVGATARLNNITFEELVSTLGTMADAGIRSGSTMSTGLRQMLVDFIDPSKKLIAQLEKVGLTTADIDVKTLGLVEVLTRLRDSGFQAFGSLETRAAAAFSVLSTNIPRMQELEAVTLRQGVAAEAAATRIESLSARWQRLINTLGETGQLLGEVIIPLLKGVVFVFQGLVEILNFTLSAIGDLIGGLFSLAGGFEETGFTAEQFRQQLIDAGVSGNDLELAMENVEDSLHDVETATRDTKARMAELETQESTLKAETDKLILRKDSLSNSTSSVAHQVNVLASRFPGLRTEFAKTQGGIEGLIQSMVRLETQARKTLVIQARVLGVQANQRRRNANSQAKEVGGSLRDALFPLTRKREITGLFSSGGARDKTSVSQARRLESLIKGKKWDQAFDYFQSLPSNSELKNTPAVVGLMNDIPSFRLDYEEARNDIRQSNFLIEQDQFLDSPGGQIINRARSAVGIANRVASQGSAQHNGRTVGREDVVKGLNFRLKDLAELRDQLKGNEAALASIGAAETSVQAALNQHTPVAEEKSSGGGGGGGGRSTKRSTGSSGRSATPRVSREERDFQRNELKISREEKQFRLKKLQNSLDGLEEVTLLEDLPLVLDEVDENLQKWLNTEQEQAVAQIISSTGGVNNKSERIQAQRAKMLETASRKAEELRVEYIDKIAVTLSRAISEFVQTSTKGIEDQYREATRFTQRNLAQSQARVQGLSRVTSLSNQTPNHFVTVQQRQADLAEERALRAQIPAKNREIASRQEVSDRALDQIVTLARDLEALGKIKAGGSSLVEEGNLSIEVIGTKVDDPDLARFKTLIEDMREYDKVTQGMIDTNDDLEASFAVLDEVPRTLSEGLKSAYEAVKIEIGSSGDFTQDIIKGLDEPIRAARDSFSTFFNEVVTGSASVGQAIKNMLSSILESIINLISQSLANQLFQQLGSLVGLDTGEDDNAATATATAAVAQGATTVAQGAGAVAQGGGAVAAASGTVVSGAATVASTAAATAGSLAQVLVTIAEAMAKVVQAAAQVAASAAGSGGAGGEGGGGLIGGLIGLLSNSGGGSWRGGEVKGFMRGGEIDTGLSTRDSTFIHAARGEFVVRKTAVDSIGTDMLNSINAQGAAALKGVGAPTILAPSSPMETNVYVVAPENKPSLGPNDVLAIVTDDVLKGGQTKKLIKKVANG